MAFPPLIQTAAATPFLWESSKAPSNIITSIPFKDSFALSRVFCSALCLDNKSSRFMFSFLSFDRLLSRPSMRDCICFDSSSILSNCQRKASNFSSFRLNCSAKNLTRIYYLDHHGDNFVLTPKTNSNGFQFYGLPHMLPKEEAFAAAVSALGIQNKDGLVVYDGKGIFSAARVWWMFRVFGHDRIWVLDGGLPQWRSSGYDVESSASGDSILKVSAASEAIEKIYSGETVSPITFETKYQPDLVWTLEQVKRNVEDQKYQHIDARGKPRIDGAVPEPRKGVRSGHVPGSKCIPFGQMLDGSQTLLPSDKLQERFEQEGISLDKPVMTSCGTGVTACILDLGLHRLVVFVQNSSCVSPTYMALQYDINERMRSILIDWLIEVHFVIMPIQLSCYGTLWCFSCEEALFNVIDMTCRFTTSSSSWMRHCSLQSILLTDF
ncbi:hypothetical protein ACHQM5_028061 [Ranunculus cassubicifolius]